MLGDITIPERINRLPELARNLWWAWHPEGRNLFRQLDYPLWRWSSHNPVQQLSEVKQEEFIKAASDPEFLAIYDKALTTFDADMNIGNKWFKRTYGDVLDGPIAYFSMEFALHNSLPIYAGGLGVLAGDLCKEASDLGVPMIAVGFMYPQGYFHQTISPKGWQMEEYRKLDFTLAPITRIYAEDGSPCLAEVILKNRTLHIGAWLVHLGNVKLYLLDTGLPQNSPEDRELSNRLYTADKEHRLQQEMLLGIGGVRVLRSLGIYPSIWHANEGHTSFMMVERLVEYIKSGKTFDDAMDEVRKRTIFTTHTPVPAGHDIFDPSLIVSYFRHYRPLPGLNRRSLLKLGCANPEDPFNMTVLALKTAGNSNAVSKLHGEVTRHMWKDLWPDQPESQVPIISITNGVHVPTWIAPEMRDLFNKYLGEDWLHHQDDPSTWDHVDNIPAEELWNCHQQLKRKMFHIILERAQLRWANAGATPQQILAMGSLLDHDTLTIGFIRRFAEYKRPALIFQDIERLNRMVNSDLRPVQFIFAGKSHPADIPSKMLLQQVHSIARDRNFQGRIAFLEDYDIRLARYLVQGIDVWLNVPRRTREASGTSGMKSCLNGGLHLSVPDGWWFEAHNGVNGWAIGKTEPVEDPRNEDIDDAASLYNLLENEVIPLFYQRDRNDLPRDWTDMMKRSIRTNAPVYSARRMVKQYCDLMYLPAARA